MTTTIYYAPEAVGSLASIFTDGKNWYERVHNIGSLGALDGWLKKIGKRIKKVAKKSWKVVKKVGRGAVKVLKKVLPIASTVLSFVPGVGWAASAALMAAEMGINAADKAIEKNRKKKLKKKLQKQMKELNSKTTRLAKPATKVTPVNRINKDSIRQTPSVSKVSVKSSIPTIAPPKNYSAMDFMRINAAVNKSKVGVDDVIAIVNQAKRNY